MRTIFEYDTTKSTTNKAKHGIDFEEVQILWQDSFARTFDATAISGEKRYAIIGNINNKLWTAIYTQRKQAIRLISARRSREKEQQLYDNA